jgi:hypothetical protein
VGEPLESSQRPIRGIAFHDGGRHEIHNEIGGSEVRAKLEKGAALRLQSDAATAHELDAKTLLLQAQPDYIRARDEMTEAIGQTPD